MKNGTIFKYELPKGDRLILDVHPSAHPASATPMAPVDYRGRPEGDALALYGLCTIALVAVGAFGGPMTMGASYFAHGAYGLE